MWLLQQHGGMGWGSRSEHNIFLGASKVCAGWASSWGMKALLGEMLHFRITAANIACQSHHQLVFTHRVWSKSHAGSEHCYLATSAGFANEVAQEALLQREENAICK